MAYFTRPLPSPAGWKGVTMTTLYFPEDKIPQPSAIDLENRDEIIRYLTASFLNKTQSMFEWKGLPNTIPQRALEMTIQRAGKAFVFEHEGHIYQSFGNIAGTLNYNYLPEMGIVANPYIKNFGSKTMEIYYGKDVPRTDQVLKSDMKCVCIQNDPLYLGLLPLINFYASQLADNIISKRCVTINSRAFQAFFASDQSEKDDFEKFISNLKSGKITAILSKNIMKKGEMLPFAENKGSSTLTDLIEDQQYIKASFLNEVGLNANYNMKRESINSNESQLNQDALLPLPDLMLKMRKEQALLVNELLNQNWSVDFSSAWKAKRIEIEEAIDAIDQTSDMGDNEEVQPAGKERDNENT